MECEGYVSIWLGSFRDSEELMEYASEDYMEEDETECPSQFTRDFFDGKIWAFDPDFWERDIVEPSDNLAELAAPFSYGESFDVKNVILNRKYNAVILVYDFKYEMAEKPADAPVEFVAAVRYEKD